MQELILVIDILAGVGVIGLVLLQQGKGADMGAAFGSGASASLFGSRGAANFLTRTTAVLATIFFLCNLALAYLATHGTGPKSVLDKAPITQPARPDEKATDKAEKPKVPEVPK
ncbi:MAG: preprotein translocase subunit SecG [Pseudomonadota bacterium]